MSETRAAPAVTSGKAERLDDTVAVLSPAFEDDPVVLFLMSSMAPDKRDAYRPTYLRALCKAAALNDGTFQEAGDYGSVAVWMSPGKRLDNPMTFIPAGILGVLWNLGLAGTKRMFVDYTSKADNLKSLALGDRKDFYYLFITGTQKDRRGQGLCSTMIRQYQAKAREESQSLWLESTTVRSREIYAKLGFAIIGEYRLGEGTHSELGEYEQGGAGVPVWGMLWDPAKHPVDSE